MLEVLVLDSRVCRRAKQEHMKMAQKCESQHKPTEDTNVKAPNAMDFPCSFDKYILFIIYWI